MPNNPSLKERKRPNPLRPINNLIRYHKVHRLDLLSQRSHGRERNHTSNTQAAQSSDVGTVGNLVGRELVVQAVTREERDVVTVVGEDADGGGGCAPGGDGGYGGDGGEAIEGGEAGAADNGDMDRF